MTKQSPFELIQTRRAIRRFTEEPVKPEILERLLESAMWAPSAHNRQPWRFAVITDQQQKALLANAMGNRLREDRMKDGDAAAEIERDVARSLARMTGAPVLIVVFLSMTDMDVYPDRRRKEAEHTMAIQSVAMAAQNLWLAAHSQGLAMCWLCAPLFAPELVSKTLDLPSDWEPVGLMTLGYPAEEKVKKRKRGSKTPILNHQNVF